MLELLKLGQVPVEQFLSFVGKTNIYISAAGSIGTYR
jgi:hypothetical protein